MRKVLLAFVVAGLVAPAAAIGLATGEIRYTTPTGTGSTCSEANPCGLKTAIDASDAGDEVIVGPGTYGSPSPITDVLMVDQAFVVHGADGQPIPVVLMNSAGGIAVSNNGIVRRLDLRQSSPASALSITNATANQVSATAPGPGPCSLNNGANLYTAACIGGGSGVNVSNITGGTTVTATLRNVTAASGPSGGQGIIALASGSAARIVINATNTIAHGTGSGRDIFANGQSGGTTEVNLDHSNYSSVTTDAGASVTPNNSDGNQGADPEFVNPGAGDYRELGWSPTVDAGATAPTDGAQSDFDGGPRLIGPAIDIGADETPFAPRPATATNSGSGVLAAVSGYGLSRKTFAAASRGPSAQAAARRRKRKKAKVGTTVRYTLNQAATVTFTVQRRSRGRRVKRGRRRVCDKPTRKNRKKRRCTRFVRLRGSFVLNGAAGRNSFKFTGRMRNRKLKPGRYRLVATPSAGGQKGVQRRVSFRIIR